MYHTSPFTLIKEGCMIPLWAYLQDYQHENITSPSSVGGRSVIVSRQTSKVLHTASYLTFSSYEFIFPSLVLWQCCHLWPQLGFLSQHAYYMARFKECENCTVYENENLSHARKGRIEQQINGQRHQLLCISLRFIVFIACHDSKATTKL